MAIAFSDFPFLKKNIYVQKMLPLKINAQQLIQSNRTTTAFKFDSDVKSSLKNKVKKIHETQKSVIDTGKTKRGSASLSLTDFELFHSVYLCCFSAL